MPGTPASTSCGARATPSASGYSTGPLPIATGDRDAVYHGDRVHEPLFLDDLRGREDLRDRLDGHFRFHVARGVDLAVRGDEGDAEDQGEEDEPEHLAVGGGRERVARDHVHEGVDAEGVATFSTPASINCVETQITLSLFFSESFILFICVAR